ncbi:PucR family transcriptional regulator [Arthrobacter sp. SLBN-100]|uniref:PucR family transcriptional regulator n=1 Tax=Arthrobacter sp. SLBN-100 TaxID=2768450 RepID=UPI00114EB8FE|nr:helix-turn-helix domain-containing protein [Arthrobacter sp. SLBN-100]
MLRTLLLVSGSEPTIDLVGNTITEVARDFARRSITYDDLLHGIRIGYARMAALILDAADELVEPDDRQEVKRISLVLFQQIDQFMGMASAQYMQERDDKVTAESAARVDLISEVCSGTDRIDEKLGHRLGYRIDAPAHLAVIAWVENPTEWGSHSLRLVIEDYFAEIGATGDTLIVPTGAYAAWGWKALPSKTTNAATPKIAAGHYIAVGRVSEGREGFRVSHRQARAVEELLRNGPAPKQVITTHADVDLAILLMSDIDRARAFAQLHLGELAAEDQRTSVLRDTLRSYLKHQRSVIQVAKEQHISRNTVTYRVQQAFRLANVEPEGSVIRLEAALVIADWLADQ